MMLKVLFYSYLIGNMSCRKRDLCGSHDAGWGHAEGLIFAGR